jgi:hypothetical protein
VKPIPLGGNDFGIDEEPMTHQLQHCRDEGDCTKAHPGDGSTEDAPRAQ